MQARSYDCHAPSLWPKYPRGCGGGKPPPRRPKTGDCQCLIERDALDADGVATITWDLKSKAMNVLDLEATWPTLNGLIDRAIADEGVKGVILTSAKKDFAGGMDLKVIASHEGKRRR